MSEENVPVTEKDDEISLIDLFAVLLRFKWLIIGITAAAMLFVVVYSVISLKLPPEKSYLPNNYKVSANMLITDSDSSSGLSASSSASSLAKLMGVSLSSSGSSTSSLILHLTSSNPVYDAIAEHFNLYEKSPVEKSPIAMMRMGLSKKGSAEYDSSSGVLTVSYEDIDPEFAVDVVNFCVDWISDKLDELGVDNNKISKENTIEQQRIELELSAQKEVYTQLRSQLELLKVKMATEAPVFQILERASVPDIKSGPSRGKLCIIVTFAAFFVSIFLAFLINAIKNMKNDPEVMMKLKGTK